MEIDLNKHLPELHCCHLKIATEIKNLCEKHNIKYFIIAGTLLGAVRHKGFIPWDDDMDIGMLREDYDKFINIASRELGECFELQTFETDPDYGLPFAKMLLKNTKLVEAGAAKNSAKKAIFVDVFPFDSAPDDLKIRKKHNRKTYFLKRLFLAKQKYKVYADNDLKKRIVYMALAFMAAFLTKKKICALLEKEIRRYNNQNTIEVVNVGGAYGYDKECVKKVWFNSVMDLPFEETTLAAPVDYVSYLEFFYGDYMTPPPPEKRYNRHNLLELDFGPYLDNR